MVKQSDVSQSVISQVVSYHTSIEDAKESDKSIQYIMHGGGVKEIRSNEIGTFAVDASSVPGLDEIQSGFFMNLPKVPYNILLETLEFFRWVCKNHNNAEAAVQIFWDRGKKEYFIFCPEQEVNSSTVRWNRDNELEKEHLLVLDIHSHNTMNAFFSGVDDNDEKETRIFGVIGKVTDPTPQFKFRSGCAGKWIDIDIHDVFETPYASTSFPEDWKSKVKKYVSKVKESVTTSNYGYNYNRYSNGYVQTPSKPATTTNNKAKKKQSKANPQQNHQARQRLESFAESTASLYAIDDTDVHYSEQAVITQVLDELSEEGVSLLLSKLADNGWDGLMEAVLWTKQ